MGKLLDEYCDIIHEPTYVKSEYQRWKTYESDQNLKEITIKSDNKSVNKNSEQVSKLLEAVNSHLQLKLNSQFLNNNKLELK